MAHNILLTFLRIIAEYNLRLDRLTHSCYASTLTELQCVRLRVNPLENWQEY